MRNLTSVILLALLVSLILLAIVFLRTPAVQAPPPASAPTTTK